MSSYDVLPLRPIGQASKQQQKKTQNNHQKQIDVQIRYFPHLITMLLIPLNAKQKSIKSLELF